MDAPAPAASGLDGLHARLDAICDAQPFRTTYHVTVPGTGWTAGRDAAVPMHSASTRKISIMMAAFKAAHEKRLDLTEPVVFEERLRKDVASGTYRYMTAGTTLPLRDAVVNMIITSDNVCTQMVLERLTLEEMNAFCRAVGMTDTVHRHMIPPIGVPYDFPVSSGTQTTPADQVKLLELILRGTQEAAAAEQLGCSTQLCRDAIQILGWQVLKQLIPSLLPYGTLVANKTGRGRRGRMDAGVVFRDGKPAYVMAGFTDGVPDTMPDGLPGHAAAFATVGRLSRACWDAVG